MNIGGAIKKYRAMRSLSQGTLAQEMCITQSYLSQVEGGKKTPSLELLQKAAEVLDVSVEHIFLSAIAETPKGSTTAFPESITQLIRLLVRQMDEQ